LDDGLVVFDADERIVRWNRALEMFYGVPRTNAIGRRLGDLFDQPFVDALRSAREENPHGATLYRVPLVSRKSDRFAAVSAEHEAHQETLRTPPAPREALAGVRQEGNRILVNATAVPLQSPAGDARGVVGTILLLEDITDRVRLEEQLQISEKMASIVLLSAGVAHEWNTPFTGISSFTQMLLENADPDDPRTILPQKIQRQTFPAGKIVNA